MLSTPSLAPRPLVTLEASAALPTRHAIFTMRCYRHATTAQPFVALVLGEPQREHRVLLRLHSQCFTGETFGSLRCDCGPQLDESLRIIAQRGSGIALYHFDEGRGLGLVEKIRAYALQDDGVDTVDANHLLGFPADLRDYAGCGDVLTVLGVRRVELLSNNPDKAEALRSFGIVVDGTIPLRVYNGDLCERYLAVKKRRLGHTIDDV